MPLTQQIINQTQNHCAFTFGCGDAEKPVRCCVTSDALIRKFGQLVFDTDKSNEELFITYRAQIERAASLEFDQGNIDEQGVLVTFDDLA